MNQWRKAALVVIFLGAILATKAQVNDTVTVVDGVFTNIGTFITSGTNNLLVVTNGGAAFINNIASQGGARTNVVIVTGVGSVISNTATVTFASSGSSNALLFLDGGRTRNTLSIGGTNNFVLFENTSSTNNIILGGRTNRVALRQSILDRSGGTINGFSGEIDVAASQWNQVDGVTFSDFSRDTRVIFRDGSQRNAGDWFMSGMSNRLEVAGIGTVWRNSRIAAFANGTTGNPGSVLEISAGGRVEADNLDFGLSSAYNQLIADGIGTVALVTNVLKLGGGTSNRVSLSGGATLITSNAVIGAGTGNSATILGTGTLWSNIANLQMTGTKSRLEILDGGRIFSRTLSADGNGNVVTVAPDALLTVKSNINLAQILHINGGGEVQSGGLSCVANGTKLMLSGGVKVAAPKFAMGFMNFSADLGTNTSVDITDAGTELIVPLIVATTRWQRVSVAAGATLKSTNFTSLRGSVSVNVSGVGSQWLHAGELASGASVTNDSFTVSTGGLVTNRNTIIGQTPFNGTPLAPNSGMRTMSRALVEGTGSKWVSGSNVWVGLNANSNSISVLNGGELLAENLGIGVFYWGELGTPNNRLGSENEFHVDGINSRVAIAKDILLGYGTSSNRFTISGGATVSAERLLASLMPPSSRNPNPPFIGIRSNVVEIIGPGSELILSSNYHASTLGFLVMTNHARLVATAITPGDNVRISEWSELEVDGMAELSGKNFLLEDSFLRAGKIMVGWLFGQTQARITGRDAKVGAEEIHVKFVDPLQPPPQGLVTLEILDSASVTSRVFTIGLRASNAPPAVKVNGGFVYALTPEKTGLLEINYGSLEIEPGIVRADQLHLSSTNATVTVGGEFALANGFAGGNGDLRIGADSGEVLLQGRITAGTATFGSGAILKMVATGPDLPAALTANSVALDGQLTVLLAQNHRLQIGNSVVLVSAPTITGAFDNVSFGERIATPDGAGSFLLTKENGKVVLVDFQSDIHVSANLDASAATLTLSFPAGLNPQIQTSTNLVDWVTIPSPQFQSSNGEATWSAEIVKEEPSRFYRLVR